LINRAVCQCPIAGFIISTVRSGGSGGGPILRCQCPIAGFIISTGYNVKASDIQLLVSMPYSGLYHFYLHPSGQLARGLLCQCPIAGFIISTFEFAYVEPILAAMCQCPIAGFIISTHVAVGTKTLEVLCQCPIAGFIISTGMMKQK